jgi:hypothetical protein
MTMLPSLNQWVDKCQFNANEGMDTFLSMVWHDGDDTLIYIDGKKFTSVQPGAARSIAGTDLKAAAFAISSGSHVITTARAGVRFMAWPHESLDGLQMGRAAASPAGFNAAVPSATPDTIVFSSPMPMAVDTSCGRVSSAVSVKGTSGLAFVYATTATNYRVAVAPFATGAEATSFTLEPINPTKSSSAVLRVVTKSGTFAEKTYTYKPDSLRVATKSVAMTVGYRVPFCLDVPMTNISANDIVVHAFTTTTPNVVVAPLSGNALIRPGADTTMQVCMTPSRIGTTTDTMFIDRTCFQQPAFPLNLVVVTPTMVSDDVSFGTVSPLIGTTTRTAAISNTSNVAMIIDSLTWKPGQTDDHFSLDPSTLAALPVVVQPKSAFTVGVAYAPRMDTGTHTATIRVYSSSASADNQMVCTARSSYTVDVADEDNAPLSPSVSTGDEIMIYDVRGVLMARRTATTDHANVRDAVPSSFHAGVYLVVVVHEHHAATHRVLVTD